MSNALPPPSIERDALLDLLDAHFNDDEAVDLVFRLDLDRDNLPGETKRARLLELIEYFDQRQEVERLIAEVAQLRRNVLDPGTKYVIPPPPACPYPGMAPYTAAQANVFFGRKSEIQDMLQHLHRQRTLFLIGPSCAGKSSLVHAGLLPRLETSPLFPQGFWLVRQVRPAAQPLRELIQALGGNVSQLAEAVRSLLSAAAPAQRLLLVIDQFEQVFTRAERDEQRHFMTIVKELQAVENAAVLITMRADFFSALIDSPMWPIQPSERMELAPLRDERLREAIQGPAEVVQVKLDAGLVEVLLADAAQEPGVMPLVQETMQLLWGHLERRRLPLKAYQELGTGARNGLAVAISRKADAVLDDPALSPIQRDIARRVLLSLVQYGEAGPDTRRQQLVEDLRSPSDNEVDFDRVLDHLTQNHLIVRTVGQDGQSASVDLAHEVLISSWPRLRTWLTEDRADQLVHRRLEQAADEWHKRGRDSSYLYVGARLLDAQRFAYEHPQAVSQDEVEFLGASDKRNMIRVRSRYFGQAAGAGMGAAFGYSLAFALVYLLFPSDGGAGLDLLPVVLMWFPLGALVGFSIGLGLWFQRDNPVHRPLASGVLGALTSGLALLLILMLLTPALTMDDMTLLLGRAVASALIGGGLGIGAGWRELRWHRLIATPLGGGLGALLAVLAGGLVDIDNFWLKLGLTVVCGLVIGALTGLGLFGTAVEPNVHSAPPSMRSERGVYAHHS